MRSGLLQPELIALLASICACKKSDENPATSPTKSPPPEASADGSASDGGDSDEPSAPPPSELPICSDPADEDPLSILCTIGNSADRARFECDDPEPLLFCRRFDEWSCKYMAPAGETPPAVTYRARFEHDGPPVQSGQLLDMSKFSRKGTVKGASAWVEQTDAASGAAQATAWAKQLEAWGCVEVDQHETRRRFDCGTWEAETSYNDITDDVILEAAEKGLLDCGGA